MAAGTPGWVGRRVELVQRSSGEAVVLARVWLDDSGVVDCDRPELLRTWLVTGIVGRSDRGRLFPRDGQRFLDELPFVYQSFYLSAVPVRGDAA